MPEAQPLRNITTGASDIHQIASFLAIYKKIFETEFCASVPV